VVVVNKLDQDLASEEFANGERQRFWEFIERTDSKVFIRMYAADGRSYVLALDCTSYGDEPLEGLFVDPETRQVLPSAWPQGDSTFEQWVKFKNDHFICWREDRRGLQQHPNWRPLKAWQKPNQLVSYLNFIRQLLHLKSRGYLRLVTIV
jgi:hypothetical protein